MPAVGVRELKTRASEILRDVRDRRARYTLTYRGRPVGLLLPLPPVEQESLDEQDAWAELTRLGEEIARGWQLPHSSTDLLSQMRR